MILLDAYALIALARDEPAAAKVEELVRRGDAAVSAVNLFETVDVLVRRSGWPAERVSSQLGLLVGESMSVVPLDDSIAWRGALLRARHYDRTSCDLSLADCVLLATAGAGDAIATADRAISTVAEAEGIDLVELPSSM